MWYVVQTRSGNEENVSELMKKLTDPADCKRCFIPLYEDVRKKDGKGRIFLHHFFPGYFFVETDTPEKVFRTAKRIPEFTRVLGSREKEGEITFLPVGKEDEDFLESLLDQGVMRVSYIKRSTSGRIEKIVGPLEKYSSHITKLDVMRRRAIVEIELFGKKRKLKFGLWTDDDPPIAWIRESLERKDEASKPFVDGIEIGIHLGDRVRFASSAGEDEVYGGQIFIVEKVDPARRKVYTSLPMINTIARMEFSADEVEVVKHGTE